MIARVLRRGMAKRTYDPNDPPNPAAWLSLAEETRIEIVRAFHHREGQTHPPAHWTIHVIVENQAADPDLPTAAVLARLQRERLTRHDAIHAVGTILVASLSERIDDTTPSEEAANAAADIERDGECWIWIEPATQRLLGTFRLDGTRLSVETFSRSRDRRACQLVTTLAADAVDYEGTALSDPGSSAHAAGPSDDGIADAGTAAMMQEFYERHDREWVDTPVPALNGRTPRHLEYRDRGCAGKRTPPPIGRLVGNIHAGSVLKEAENAT